VRVPLLDSSLSLALAALGAFVVAVGCGGGSAASAPEHGGGASDASSGAQCVDAPPKNDLCDILVGYFSRCAKTSMPSEYLVDDCRNTWSGFTTRANACFTEQLSKCLAAPCEQVDTERCFREATVASDPESFSQAPDQCIDQGDCQGNAGAWLSRCEKRFGECGAFEDVCKTALSLQRRYRTEVDACLSGGCDALEDCVYRALGQL
jgi:hypothetical protein